METKIGFGSGVTNTHFCLMRGTRVLPQWDKCTQVKYLLNLSFFFHSLMPIFQGEQLRQLSFLCLAVFLSDLHLVGF
jgi:hypothetical protein